MIIGIDASRANHENKTGVEWYASHLIQALKKLSIINYQLSLTFVLYSNEPMREPFDHLPKNWESKVLRWPPGRLWTQVRLSWEMLCNPPDVLFVPSHVFPIIHPKKTVMMVHDVGAMRFPESYSWFQRWYTLWSARAALRRLWKVIVPSEFTRRELIEAFQPKADPPMAEKHESIKTGEKLTVVRHGYDRRYRKMGNPEDIKDIEKILEKYSIKTPFILSVGRLEEKKNTRRIIEALNIVRSNIHNSRFKILLIGSPGHGYEKVRDAINASPFKGDIIELGHVEPDDLVYIMNAAEVFVFPSLYEGFGLPILESMACGTPVVASRGNSLEEVGGDAALYVNPENVEEIADGIHRVMNDASLHNDLVGKGFERVKSFSWEKCAEETLQLLLES